MLDIGSIHRREYEIEDDPSCPVVIAQAPGRIYYLGEHGEPKAGLFLTSAIDRSMRVAVSARRDNSLRFYAADLGERKRTTLINLKYKREDRWANYIKVAIQLFAELNYPVKALNFTVMGNIPQQVGMGSSQAIEVAAVIALRAFLGARINSEELIDRLAAVHTAFYGKSVNMADYLTAMYAKKDYFLVINEAALDVKAIKSPFTKQYRILIMDSRVPRMGVEDELTLRRRDIRKALEMLTHKKSGGSFHNYVTEDLVNSMGSLPEEIRRRGMHVVQEIRRIYDAETALGSGDFATLSRVIFHSHESLRDLYEVSCPEIDWLVKRAQEIEGVVGSRMTGQGFGGCTYTIVREDAISEYRRRLEDYERIFGFHPLTSEIRPASGAKIVKE